MKDLFDHPSAATKKLTVYSDGGARGNPGPAAIGVLILDASGEALQEHMETIGDATNNVAEYRAVIKGLELAKGLGGDEIDYFVDSELVAHQLTGKYRIKTPHIRDLFLKVREREKDFKRVSFTHVPRTHEKIYYVDKLVNQALNQAGF
jgi:ribonuclease HI